MSPRPRHAARLLTLFFVGLALCLGGCAEEVGDVDRTQANKLSKEDFAGIWYMTRTVTEVPYGVMWSFGGELSLPLRPGFDANPKVIWDIQEKHLIAYPTSESILGGDVGYHSKNIRKYWDREAIEDDDPSNDFIDIYVGQPIAAFQIVSHFDVIRDYSTSTGSQSNVIVENTSDRPWWQREFIRVDWSKDSVADFMFISGNMPMTGVPYYVQETDDPNNPDLPEVTGDYIGVVVKYFGEPAYAVYGNYPGVGCNIYGLSDGDCAGGVVKARLSFKKVNPVPTYEPKGWHNAERQDRFGFFQTDRYTYSEDTGLTYSGQDTKINRWNLWRQSWRFSDLEKRRACLVNTDCDLENNEFCAYAPNEDGEVEWFNDGVCQKKELLRPTERYDAGRGIKPIVYHLSADYPEHLLAPSYAMADDFNDAYKDTLAWMLFWDEKDGDNGGMYFTRYCDADADCASAASMQRTVDVPTRGRTVIAVNDAEGGVQTLVTHDGTYPPSNERAGAALVRFVNADPASGSLNLQVGGQPVIQGVDFNADATHETYTVVNASGKVNVQAAAGGSVVAERTNMDFRPGRIFLFVYAHGKLHAATTTLVEDAARPELLAPDGVVGDNGVRVINLLEGLEEQHVILNGARRAAHVAYGDASGYINAGYAGRHKVSLVAASGRQDVTCFHDANAIGRCIGPKPELTDADHDRVAEIKASLPDPYVLCRNKWSGSTCDGRKGDKADIEDCRYTWSDDQGAEHNACFDDVIKPESLKKAGDNRYSFVYYWHEPMSASPTGYGPSAADPDTGEIFHGSANMYGSVLVYLGQYYADIFDILNGDLDVADLATGKHIRDYLKSQVDEEIGTYNAALTAYGADLEADVTRAYELNPTKVHPKLPAQVASAMHIHHAQPFAPATGLNPVTTPELWRFANDQEHHDRVVRDFVEQLPTRAQVTARFDRIKGTRIERMMINDEVKVALSKGRLTPNDSVSEEDLETLSPTKWASFRAVQHNRAVESRLMQAPNNTCYFTGEFIDDKVFGIAKQLKDEGLDSRQMALRMEQIYYEGVLSHEVGHTVGLRHNFAGTADLYNYHDEYYDIRQKERVPCQNDNWCEPGNNETCRFAGCQTAADCKTHPTMTCGGGGPCGPQLTCGSSGECTDAVGNQLGFCATTLNETIPCEKGCTGGTICDEGIGLCAQTTPCNATTDCGEAQTCAGGRCMLGDVPVLTPVTVQNEVFVEKYLPRPMLSDAERLARRTEYQESTMMDYSSSGGWHGIGKYDRAAIKAGYGDLLEVYRDTSRIYEYIENSAAFYNSPRNQFSGALQTEFLRFGGVFSSPFDALTNQIGIQENLQRETVPREQVRYEHQMVDNFERNALDFTYIEVPYRACYDEFRGNMGCYIYDTGVDVGEIVFNSMQNMSSYYFFDAFKRESYSRGLFGNANSYFNRLLSRYLQPIGSAGQYYALYNHILGTDYGAFLALWKDAPYLGRPLRLASESSLQFLSDVLASPAPGSFVYDAETERYTNIGYEMGMPGSELDIPLGPGRFPYTQFRNDGGYYDYRDAVWFGSFWEKLAALLTLTDSTAYFTTDFAAELELFQGTSIGFNTLYQVELTNVLGGIIADELHYYAGMAENDDFRARRVIGPGAGEADGLQPGSGVAMPVVEPSIHDFTLKLYAAVYGLANLPAGFDPTFIDSLSIVYEGNGSEYDLNGDVERITFTDPFGQKSYAAWTTNYAYIDEYGQERSPFPVAHRMLEKANELKAEWDAATGPEKDEREAELRELIVTLDLLRDLNGLFGSLTY